MKLEICSSVSLASRRSWEERFYGCVTWEREFKCSADDRPKRNILTKWYTGSFDDIADAKEHHMGASGFKSILGEFPQAFDQVKLLCEKIRSILFPLLNDGALFIGTSSDPPEELCRPIIEAFDSAIADIAVE